MLSWHPRNSKLPFWQFVNNVVNLFAHWLEVRRMQSALFILRIKYTSSLLGCQDIFLQKPAYFLVTQAKIHLYSAKRKEVFRMQNERENNQRNQKENQNQRENKNEQRNQKENRK